MFRLHCLNPFVLTDYFLCCLIHLDLPALCRSGAKPPKTFAGIPGGSYIFCMAAKKSDIELVEGYLAGHSNANRFVEDCIEIAFRSWRDRFGYQTDDILSDARYKLYLSLNRGDFAGKASLRAYISGIVRHTCLDYYRAQKRIEKVDIEECPLADSSLSAQEGMEKREAAMLYFRVLRLVPKECLELFKLKLREGLRCSAIGERLGKLEVNIRGKLMKCRRKAREIREKLQKKEKRF
jgi:RNA polymerase sigma factor (sigma-70 family)